MKSIGFALFCLLCTVAWAQDGDPQAGDDDAASPIAFSVFYATQDPYAISKIKANWYQAELYCRSDGYTLLDIPSELEQYEIEQFLGNELADDPDTFNTSPVWTSGSNHGSSTKFVWSNTGERISYNEFLVPPTTKSTRCIGYNTRTNKWSNHNCRDERYFMCRKFTLGTCA
ncbi:hypothetical protein ACLKA7_014034 [Drosophila subpalustris]